MPNIRIAVLDDYWHIASDSADWSSLDSANVDFYHDTLIDIDAIVERLQPYDAVVTTRERTMFPAQVLEGLPNLKLIAGTGAGQAKVDIEKANELGIIVCTTGGSKRRGNDTAELCWALILGVTRHIAIEDRQMRQGNWQTRPAEGLGGKTLGILGLGRLGTAVAGYGNHFDMDVIAWGPTLDAERATANGVTYVTWDELFSQSDILSIHVPLTDLSRGWVTEREFGLMKSSAYLVNTSRGPIVDEPALVTALQNGQIAGAALDVYDVEPVQAGHPLLKLDNVLLAPHLGYSTVGTIENFMELSLENLKNWMDGEPRNVLNPDALANRR